MRKIPLVLVSGLLSNECVWSHPSGHLGDIAAIQVISPSEDTPDKMVQAILEKAPPRFALAGHSMGGWLCLEVMKRVPSRVTKLCLLNTTARMDTPEKRAARQEMIRRVEKGEFRTLIREMVDHFVFNSHVRGDVEKMFLEVGEEVFVRQEKSMLQRSECQSILPKIACPTLVIHSAHDKIFSIEDHRELADRIPGAKLAIIDDSGHMTSLEMPQAVTTLLRFWLTYF